MTKEDFQKLNIGDIVRHRNSGSSVIITANYKDYVIGVKTYHLTNFDEWLLISKANYKNKKYEK